ncbi:uncharacterized protein METZ01_LOCUS465727, partial [marine metagenome]
MLEPVTIIVNPVAGKGRARRQAEQATSGLRERGLEVEVLSTQRAGEAGALAERTVENGCRTVLVCGGDGTISEVLPAIASTQTLFGVLPFGTANDFARALGIPRQLPAVLDRILTAEPACLDLGRVGDRHFATVAAFGFDANVSQAMAEGRAPLSGTIGYLLAALSGLRRYQPPEIHIKGDFGANVERVYLVATANTRSYGGGMQIAPHADPTDGLLDVCTVSGEISRATALSILPQV